jgi:site-specific recombinase XerD
MANKKRNNLRLIKGNYYYRLRIWTGYSLKEVTIPLKTKKMDEAIRRGKIVTSNSDAIKSGAIQRFQFKEYFPWLNDKGTSTLPKLSIGQIMDEYIKYRHSVVHKSTAVREEYVLKQFYRYIGKTKPVAEITYKNIEQGFIPHLKEQGRSNAGINFSLRHLKIWFNWMYDREKIIPERIKFKMLPEDILPCYINEKEMNDVQGEVDDFTGRCLYFYQSVGCRAKEPFKGFIEGNYLKIPPDETKGKKHWRFIHLYSDELKYILMEMRDWRDGYIEEGREYDNAIHRCYEVLRQRLDKAKKKLGIGTNRKITLKSYRHAYGIVRVHMTGNIQGVAIEMGHSNLSTTQKYLNIPPDMVADDFPSVKQYLKLNEPKMGNKVTDCRVTPISLGAHV